MEQQLAENLGMVRGGVNEKWLTYNPCVYWANLLAHEDNEYVLRELRKDVKKARERGVPEEIIKALLEEAYQEREVLVQMNIKPPLSRDLVMNAIA